MNQSAKFTYDDILAADKKLAEQRRKLRKFLKKEDNSRGGGWNKKTIEEHLLDGTYRADRHGPLTPGTLGLKKPPGKITASVLSQSKWIRNAADEHAVHNGCRFNERLAEYTANFFPTFL